MNKYIKILIQYLDEKEGCKVKEINNLCFLYKNLVVNYIGEYYNLKGTYEDTIEIPYNEWNQFLNDKL